MIRPGIARIVSLALIGSLGAPACLCQAPPAPAAPAELLPSRLKIHVLEGNNAVNSIGKNQTVTPVVEVRDENEFPVEGATVVFTLPENGPGGRFAGGQLALTTRSSVQGQAFAPFMANGLPGAFEIKVAASAGPRKGEISITQTNAPGDYFGPPLRKPAWYRSRRLWILAGAAAGATILAVVLTGRGGSGPAVQQTITITPGGPGVGGPR